MSYRGKILKKQSIVMGIIVVGCFLRVHADPFEKVIFTGRPWDFLEHVFVLEPEKKANSIMERVKRLGAGAALGIAGGAGTYYGVQGLVGSDGKSFFAKQSVQRLLGTTVGLGSGLLSYKLLEQNTKRQCDRKGFFDFMREWPENRKYVPQMPDILGMFDELYEEWREHKFLIDSEMKKIAESAVSLVRERIYNHGDFKKKYKHRINAPDKNFFDRKILNMIVSVTCDIPRLIYAIWDTVGKEMYYGEESPSRMPRGMSRGARRCARGRCP